MTPAEVLALLTTLPSNLRDHLGPFTLHGCVPWEGYIDPEGYGRSKVGGRSLYAHRLVYEFLNGPIPPGYQVGHLCADRGRALTGCAGKSCHHRRCVSPDHLELLTAEENQRRARAAGHLFTHRYQLTLVGDPS